MVMESMVMLYNRGLLFPNDDFSKVSWKVLSSERVIKGFKRDFFASAHQFKPKLNVFGISLLLET